MKLWPKQPQAQNGINMHEELERAKLSRDDLVQWSNALRDQIKRSQTELENTELLIKAHDAFIGTVDPMKNILTLEDLTTTEYSNEQLSAL